jgi:AraC-like DNA-binding protein
MAEGFSTAALSWHVTQYAPCDRVPWKPRTPRRRLITVSAIVGPLHRWHLIAISTSGCHASERTLIRHLKQTKNSNRWITAVALRMARRLWLDESGAAAIVCGDEAYA